MTLRDRQWKTSRWFPVQAVLTLIGAGAFCAFSQSWVDTIHLVYDIPAGLATFAFIAQLVIELGKDGPVAGRQDATSELNRFSLFRCALVAALTVVTVGRQYAGWPISGHLSCVLAIAFTQWLDRRLGRIERALYWVPVPIILYLRLALLEHGGHWGTYNAILFAGVWGVPSMLLAAKADRPCPRT